MSGFSFPLPGVGGILRGMDRMRGVGLVVVAVVTVSGCGGGGDARVKASSSPTASAAVSATPEAEESSVPLTPEERVDALAEAGGWMPEESASAYVADICGTLTELRDTGEDPVQWLTLDRTGADHAAVLQGGVPVLCPEWSKTVARVLGAGVRFYSDGTYRVKAKPGLEADAIAPGSYRVVGALKDCYWERTSRSGEVLDNGFATSAQDITVTVRPADGQFTARGCGVWKPVK